MPYQDPTEDVLSSEMLQDLETIQAVERTDRATIMRQLLSRAILLWKMDHYLQMYATGSISLAQAAQSAGITLWEMMDYASARRVTSQYDLNAFQHDWITIRKHLENSREARN